MKINKTTLDDLRDLVKQTVKEELDNTSYNDQKNWSEKKTRMYDKYADAHNTIEDLKDNLKQAIRRKDKEDIKRIVLRIKELEIAKETAKDQFHKL